MPELRGSSGKLPGSSRVTVFEAVNDSTKEVFVGFTTLGMHELIAEHRVNPPPSISHWKNIHKINYRSIEFNLSADDARQFIRTYSRSANQTAHGTGWHIIKQPV